MTRDLDRAVRSSLGDIIAAAPEPDDQPMRLTVGSETHNRRPYLAVAALLVVLAGIGGLVAVSTNEATPVAPAAAPIATHDSSAPQPVTATTTTAPGDTVSSAVANATPSCAIGAQVVVPNVAGMTWVHADVVLATAGLESYALPELSAPTENARDADYYVIVRQKTAPGTITSCGTIVDIMVAYRPGILYIVQEGDTYESIAASHGITLEQLLSFSGLSAAELEASGQSPATPLALGQAVPISIRSSDAEGIPPGDSATPNTAPTTTMP
jgi:hypothetical protein